LKSVKLTKLESSSITLYYKASGHIYTFVYGVQWSIKSSPHFSVSKSLVCEMEKQVSTVTCEERT